MRHMPTILRQVRRSYKQAGLFVLCVALSLSTMTAFSGFARSVAAPCSTTHVPSRRRHYCQILRPHLHPTVAGD
jgi:hypothetical protein